MRDQQNPSTPDLHQPLLFAPSELLACGLRDAHHHPLVGIRTEDGVKKAIYVLEFVHTTPRITAIS